MIIEICAITIALSTTTIAGCTLLAFQSLHQVIDAMKGAAGPVVGLVNAFTR